MTNYWTGEFELEGVIADNQFHRKLANVRNRQTIHQHPELNYFQNEQIKKERQALSTMYQIPAMSNSLVRIQIAKKLPEDTGKNVVPFLRKNSLHDFVQVSTLIERETIRAEKFKRSMSVLVVAFKDLIPLAALHGITVYERCFEFVSAALLGALDKDVHIVGLYGPDRLLILLPETTGSEAVYEADRIRALFEKTPLTYRSCRFDLKASIGIATLAIHGHDWKELVARADLAADSVMERGGNGFAYGPV